MRRRGEPVRLAVDMLRCDGHGICAFVDPDHVRLDRWGFPLVDARPLHDLREQRSAHRAVRACPKRALSLVLLPTPVDAPTVKT